MRSKTIFTALLATLLVTSLAAPAAMAAPDFNENASAAQNPYIEADVTVENFDRETMSPGQYEDDSGEIATLPATVDQSQDVADIGTGTVNPYGFVATDVDFSDGAAFPHSDDNVSAVHNESRWTIDQSGTAGSITIADSSTAPGVEALAVSTSSQTSGDTATASFSDVSITSDAQKRYLQAMVDVNTLDSGATVEIRAVDADGDYVTTMVNASASASDDDVIATGTGEGYVIQEQVGALTTQGSGDGTMGEIQSIDVVVADGDATVQLSALNADKTSEWSLGDKRIDTDDDDDFETETIRDVSEPGAVQVYDMDTLGSAFANAEISGLEMPMHFRASDLESDEQEVNVSFAAAESYPSFEHRMEAYYRLELPSAYDVSYANAALKQDVTVPNSRYQTVEISEGASDTEFSEISGWTSVLGSIASQGDTVTLDDTIQPGQEIGYHGTVLVTADEKSAIEQLGGGVGQFSSSGGGIWDMIISPFGGLAALVTGVVARVKGLI
ncbi:hypothetical protein EXE53_19195 [Halorubrum sp. SD626R]|uniref:hypothetical protein n=1 Tax=Halorubrum sp. SD626R TaxID=1419722 RepID=UPI0010F762B5|nr:hypothetical protein [Halorubrum sp. SD626R]TKX78824.1 hypothetical protein EXE53_19195 [Halorubrum sp. SD626R]